ncbi:hypothetical protein K432DRAFT_463636, partial [Lepidopterella palustris CBS 459.81]
IHLLLLSPFRYPDRRSQNISRSPRRRHSLLAAPPKVLLLSNRIRKGLLDVRGCKEYTAKRDITLSMNNHVPIHNVFPFCLIHKDLQVPTQTTSTKPLKGNHSHLPALNYRISPKIADVSVFLYKLLEHTAQKNIKNIQQLGFSAGHPREY